MENKVRTRFAPSPTGRMHVGNLRTALYAYLIAKHEGGDFILRIEDTDQERFMEGALEIIYHTLEETGLVHDEGPDKDGGVGPYVQSERNQSGLYLEYAKKLIEQGDAYYCFCDKERLASLKSKVTEEGGPEIVVYDKHCLGLSKEEVEANLAAGKPYVIRFNMPTEGETTFHDDIYGDITVPNEELEDLILGAEDKLYALEFELFSDIRDQVGAEVVRIQRTAKAVAALDVFASLALVAQRNNFVRPKINETGLIDIRNGRHPVVEQMIENDMFIPNDTYLDNHKKRISIITGPNMAGKSTYMRQTALIVLMAQIGSFVPADSANIGVVDRIFTRVGASDDLASGQSTFMVEMTEVANILRNATSRSLLILDEIGRGTSTFDGLSIAWAVIEHISNTKLCGAKTLFATHYHELTELEGKLSGVNNYCIAVKEKGERYRIPA